MSEHHPRLLRGILLIMLAVFLFSSMDTLAKFMLRSYPLPPLIWARYAVHFAFMIALLAPRMGLGLVRTQRPLLQLLRGLALVASTGFFYLALLSINWKHLRQRIGTTQREPVPVSVRRKEI